MGNSLSSGTSSNDNSQQPTPNSTINQNYLAARLSGLSLGNGEQNYNNSANNLHDSSLLHLPSTSSNNGNNQGPPSLAAAANIAARQRLIEELQYLAQQRYIDEVTINYNLNNQGTYADIAATDGDGDGGDVEDNSLLAYIEMPEESNEIMASNNLRRSDPQLSRHSSNTSIHQHLQHQDQSNPEQNDIFNINIQNDDINDNSSDNEDDDNSYSGISLFQRIQISLLRRQQKKQ
uniref:Uncharacterized protein n=1 Tax=Panagrolaimus superbus TaxID=310955 RepID=A0A914Y215_9BILA